MEIKKMHVGVLVILLVALILAACPAYADDELNLTGTVTDIDAIRKTVTINVTSSSCLGKRKFLVDNVTAFEELLNVRITFLIDSTDCKGDEVYKVLTIGRKIK